MVAVFPPCSGLRFGRWLVGSSEGHQHPQPELVPGADSGAPWEVGFPRRGESPHCQPGLPGLAPMQLPFIYSLLNDFSSSNPAGEQ